MKHLKLTALLLALLLVLPLALSGCGKTESPDTIRVAALKGPTGMGMAPLMDCAKNNTAKQNYTFTIEGAPDAVNALLISGEVDIAAVPVNVASVLFNKTAGQIQVAGINTKGVLYLVEDGNTVQSIADLKGKTVYASGKGATPEHILNHVLTKNGLTPGTDVTVEYLSEHAEVITALAQGKATIGLLPEPNVTSALAGNDKLRIAVNMTEAWDAIADTTLVQGVIVVNKTFAETYPDAVKTFMEEYAASVEYVNANPAEASVMIEAAGIIPKAALAQKAIHTSNICLITGEEMKAALVPLYDVLFAANPASIGGTLPTDAFYYVGK
ncbi:MAG: ABC transporter substrate-binding protein [Clostridia bacterium]|nr:ABC transporter substrate-binding protein [Clostridia bacterium]